MTIFGHDFSSTEPAGSSVTFNGVSASVTSWNSKGISVVVPAGATTGQVVVNFGGALTNGVPFTVLPAPTITGMAPPSGIAGAQVTLSGYGFGNTQSGGSLLLGSTYGIVTSWSDTQIIANIASGAKSGNAQVVQSGVSSNAIPFTVITPVVTNVNPSSGPTGIAVTISGSGFGAAQGSGNVWLGNTYGIVSTWSDNQVVATVASSAQTGTLKVLQNGVWSDPLPFTVNSQPPTITLLPSMANMVVGETRTIQALNGQGAPVPGLSWTSSAPAIVSLSTDDPPILSALAPGHVTITAADGVADVIVSVAIPGNPPLPSGTILWSVPGAFSQILPAVPSPTGIADVFAVGASGNVQAATSDGFVAWTASGGSQSRKTPDFLGGLIVADNSQTITKLDGMTGQIAWTYTLANPCGTPGVPGHGDPFEPTGQTDCTGDGYIPIAVHTDGTVFVIDGDKLVGIDGATGTTKFSVQFEHNTTSYNGEDQLADNYFPTIGQLIVAGDGYAYVPYGFFTESNNQYSCGAGGYVEHDDDDYAFRMLRVGTGGDYSKIIVTDDKYWYSHDCSGNSDEDEYGAGAYVNDTPLGADWRYNYGNLISNGNSGAMLSWIGWKVTTQAYQPIYEKPIYHLTTFGADGIVPDIITTLPVSRQYTEAWRITPVLQKEDGGYFGTLIYQEPTQQNPPEKWLIAIDPSGSITPIATGDYKPLIATADGGLIAKAPDGSTVAFNTSFAPTGGFASLPTQSWSGNEYQKGSLDSVVSDPISLAGTFWALAGGNASGNGTAIQQVLTNEQQGNAKQLPNLSPPVFCYPIPVGGEYFYLTPTCGNINAIELLTDKSPDFIFQNFVQTFAPVTLNNNSVQNFTGPGGATAINVTGPDQQLTIRLSLPSFLQGAFSVQTERFDPTNHVISAVTLQGHPLAGWRYWRVYSIGANDVVVETGAYDQPGPGLKNYAGYYIGHLLVSEGWREYLRYIQSHLGAPQGSNLRNTLGGINLRSYPWPDGPLVEGYWDYYGDFTNYILNNVCQSMSCN